MGAETIDSAAARISKMFNPEPEQSEPTIDEQQVEPANTVEQEPLEAAPPEEASEQPEVPKYTVRVNGEDLEVTEDELRNGYMMQADYSRKTQEIADKRKALEAKEADMDAKLAEAEQLLQLELDDLESEEMKELREYDPEQYWKKHDRVKNKVEKFEAKKQQQQQKMLERKQKLIAEEQEKLYGMHPDWQTNEEKMLSDVKAISNILTEFGYTAQEIQNFGDGPFDTRMWRMAQEVLKAKQISAQKPETKLVKDPPKSAKPSTKPSKAEIEARSDKNLRDRLKKTGSQRDAARFFRSLMQQ